MSVRPHHDEVATRRSASSTITFFGDPANTSVVTRRCGARSRSSAAAWPTGRIRSLSERDDKASRGAEDKKPEEA